MQFINNNHGFFFPNNLKKSYDVLYNTDSFGNDMIQFRNGSVLQCKLLCNFFNGCYGFGYDHRNNGTVCYLKNRNMYPVGKKQSVKNFDLYYRSNEPEITPKQLQNYKNNYPDLSSLNNEKLLHHWNTVGKTQGRTNIHQPIQNISGKYKYQGCFHDKNNRAIPYYKGNIKSVDECRIYAEQNRNMVFGVQNGNQCFTGNNIEEAKQYGEIYGDNCGGPLGGSWNNRVYVRGEPFIPPIPHLSKVNFNARHKTK